MYIIFEGNECCGKSSHAKALKEYLEFKLAITNIIYREAPDKTNKYGSYARNILKQPYSNINNITISVASLMSEAFNSLELQEKNTVIQTRSILSTLVYSDFRGCSNKTCIDSDLTNALLELIPLFTPPDLLFFMDCPIETIKTRLVQRVNNSELDVYESLDFIKKIECKYNLFLPMLTSLWKSQTRFIRVDSNRDFYLTQSFIRQQINNHYGIYP